MKHCLLTLIGLLSAFPLFAHDFYYTYEGQTLAYTVIDDVARTCEVSCIHGASGNVVSGELEIPTTVIKGNNTEYTVTAIGYRAFWQYAPSLTKVTIPSSVTSIGDWAFNGCYSLTEIVIPNSVTSIGDWAFDWCYSLTEIVIPNSVTSIGEMAFASCTKLTEVVIPSSVASIDKGAFAHCLKLKSITVEKDNNYYTDIDGILYNKNITEIVCCPGSLTSFVIPNSVTRIGDYAFYGGYITDVTIPNSVTSIGEYAFNYCSNLTNIAIPNSVTSIGEYAFNYCSNLTNIAIPSSVAGIGNYAFSRCEKLMSITVDKNNRYYTDIDGVLYNKNISEIVCCPGGLTSVAIPNSVTTIGVWAFYYCSQLEALTIPNSVKKIGSYAFRLCEGLTEVTIGNSVTEIGDYAFQDCGSMTKVVIPASIITFGKSIFENCRNISEVYYAATDPVEAKNFVFYHSGTLYVPEEAIEKYKNTIPWKRFRKIEAYDFSLLEQDFEYSNDGQTIQYTVTDYSARTCEVKKGINVSGEVVIPTSVTYANTEYTVTAIGYDAFSLCDDLTSVIIPNSVTSISGNPFAVCPNLSSINVTADNESFTTINGALYSKDMTTLIAYPGSKTSFDIPNSVTSIGHAAVYGCRLLTSANIPSSVTSIGYTAFGSCSGLKEITIPSSVTTINNMTFWRCDGLIEVVIPNTITTIGHAAFYGCDRLTSLTIPNSVTTIGSDAFLSCSGLTDMTIGNSVTEIGESAFRWCDNLTSVNIPSSVTSIGDYAFGSCSGLKEINVASDNTTFTSQDGVLYNKGMTTLIVCPGGKSSVNIPNSVTSIGKSAFSNCINLTNVTIPNSVTSIGSGAFAHCTSLNTATIGNSVKEIGFMAFYDCSSLSEVTIPTSVTSIGELAFYYCYGLTAVYYGASVPVKGSNYIFSDYSAPTLYVPAEAVEICKAIHPWKNFATIEAYDFSAFEYTYEGQTITYTVTDEETKTCQLKKADANVSGKVVIPKTASNGSSEYTITSIGDRAFEGCSGMMEVIIPNTITSIGDYAFVDCTGLKEVYYPASEPIEGSANIFSDYNAALYVPEEAVAKCKRINPWKNFTTIEAYDFSGVEGISADADGKKACEVYNLNGIRLGSSTDGLAPGVYIVRQGKTVKRIVIN